LPFSFTILEWSAANVAGCGICIPWQPKQNAGAWQTVHLAPGCIDTAPWSFMNVEE